MSERPASSVSSADDAEIRPLTGADLAFVRYVYSVRENAIVAGSLDMGSDDFIATIRGSPWSTPMVLEKNAEPVGLALISSADTHSRNGRVTVLARRDPRECRVPFELYLRHAFWSHPLHRLYAVLPLRLPIPGSYADLLTGCGFVDEGHLKAHFNFLGYRRDIAVFGLLRSEFDAWCRESRPALLLS
jgi:hypothetical protein